MPMVRLAGSGVEMEIDFAASRPASPRARAVIVPMKTRSRWSMLAPTWKYICRASVPPAAGLANDPVSMFIPLNCAWEAIRLTSSTSWDTSTWICIRSSSV